MGFRNSSIMLHGVTSVDVGETEESPYVSVEGSYICQTITVHAGAEDLTIHLFLEESETEDS